MNDKYIPNKDLNFRIEYGAWVNAERAFHRHPDSQNLLEVMSKSRTTLIGLKNLVENGDGLFDHYYDHYMRTIRTCEKSIERVYKEIKPLVDFERRKPAEKRIQGYKNTEIILQTLEQCRICFCTQVRNLTELAKDHAEIIKQIYQKEKEKEPKKSIFYINS